MTLCCLLAAGCSKSSGKGKSSGGKINIMLTVSDGSDTFRANLADAARKAAEEKGISLEVKDAKGSSETQMNQIKEAKDADVIICALCDAGTAQQMEALAGDKPIVFINSAPEEEYLQKDQYIYVGSDEAVAGELQAKYVLDQYASKDTLNVAIFKGESTHSATKGRTKANKAALEASGKPSIMFMRIMQTGPRIRQPKCSVSFCGQDRMWMPSFVTTIPWRLVWYRRQNRKSWICPSSRCWALMQRQMVLTHQKGKMACTIFQPAKGQGEEAVLAAQKLAAGESITSLSGAEKNGLYVWVPFEQVTSDNVTQYQ